MASPNLRKRKRSDFFDLSDQTIVALKIGSEEDNRTYNVHRELICGQSSYCRTAFKGRWKSASEKTITLEDVTPKIFDTVMRWLYRDAFDAAPAVEKDDPLSNGAVANRTNTPKGFSEPSKPQLKKISSAHHLWYQNTLDVYIFADKYDFPKLKQTIINAWQESDDRLYRSGYYMYTSAVEKAFDNLSATDNLCQYLVTRLTYLWYPRKREELEKFPKDFLVGVAFIALTEFQKPFAESPLKNWCNFHDHTEEEERKECEATWKALLHEREGEYSK